MVQATRLIKKYPNRRLYDTQASSYVTLADLKALVVERESFWVADARTGEDLTRAILLQIVLEEENGASPMFSVDLLAQMIRFYGNAMQGMMAKCLESNFKAFSELQTMLQEPPHLFDGESPQGKPWQDWPALHEGHGVDSERGKRVFVPAPERAGNGLNNVFQGHPFVSLPSQPASGSAIDRSKK